MELEKNQAISAFDKYFPLPFRVLGLINFGLWLWHLNLLTCKYHKIDALSVLKFSHHEMSFSRLLFNTWAKLIKISFLNIINYSIYFFLVSNQISAPFIDWLPLFGICLTFTQLLYPSWFSSDYELSPEAERLSETIKRVIQGKIDINIRTNDILLTDTFTSYNKVLVDFLVYFSTLLLGFQSLPSGEDLSKELSKDHLQLYNIDLLLANLPSFLRLKQCWFEYNQSRRKNRQHLFNAVKYSTAFLPTICNILLRSGYIETQTPWYYTSFINSSYSFYWDVTNDWNFGFFYKFLNKKTDALPLLRNKLIYSKAMYFFAIFIDFQLRFIWIFKFLYSGSTSTGFFTSTCVILFTTELGNFILEILEILRRWVWVFLKLETEYIKLLDNGEQIELQSIN